MATSQEATRSKRRTTQGPSSMQWEANRADIARLYCDENLSLKEVMEKMKPKMGSRAT